MATPLLTAKLASTPTTNAITDGTNGKVYVVAGGSALYVSNWNYVGGQQSSVTVDPWVLTNKLLAYPLDGTFIRDGSNNKVYRIAGGSAMYVQNWANVGGQQTAVLVDPAVFTNELLNYPADGTFIRDGSNGKVYVVAGGAPLYVSDWANVGGQQAATTIDPWVFTNKLLTYPMDGTLVKGYVSQDEYQIVSQAAVYIADPGQVSGPRVIVDDWAIDNQLLAQ